MTERKPMANAKSDRVKQLAADDTAHPVWSESFQEGTRIEQLNEDLEAGRRVSAVLVAIVTLGLFLGILTVLICM